MECIRKYFFVSADKQCFVWGFLWPIEISAIDLNVEINRMESNFNQGIFVFLCWNLIIYCLGFTMRYVVQFIVHLFIYGNFLNWHCKN